MVSHGDHLLLCSVFYCFPVGLQKNTLQFICENFANISPPIIIEWFVDILQQNRPDANGWNDFYFKILLCSCKKEKEKEKRKSIEENQTKLFSVSSSAVEFSTSTNARFLNLIEKLRAGREREIMSNILNVSSTYASDNETEHEDEKQPNISLNEDENLKIQKELDCFMETDSSVAAIADFLSPTNVNKLMDCQTTELPVEALAVHDTELQMKALQVKQSWLNHLVVEHEIVLLLTNLPSHELKRVLEIMNMSNLPNASIALACQTLIDCSTEQISYQNVLLFANMCLLPQILLLEQSASRLFVGAVVNFVKVFPLQSIEGIFQPLLHSSEFGLHHAELMSKLFRDSLLSQHHLQLLNIILDGDLKLFSDQNLLLLQSLIDTKVELPKSILGNLLHFLDKNCASNISNLKFGKLLLSFIQIYGNLFNSAEKKQLNQVAAVHKTFLSKSIKVALDKIST